MSQWTHVAGLIRFDFLPILNNKKIIKILETSFGNTVDYDDSKDKWNACSVPCGSERSVQYKIIPTGKDNSLAWSAVCIWGDLRDYENPDEIFNWIEKACENLDIRSCSVKIDVEYQNSYLIFDMYNEQEGKTEFKMIVIKEGK